jgi:RNA polymerase sigma factor (sigma-70 family)
VRPLDEYELRAFFNDGYDRLVGRLDGWSCQPWAEDLVQEALLRAWERARGGEAVISLHAWVTTVATNLARSQLRRQQAERRAMARLLGAWPEWLVGQTGAAADLIDDHVDELRELLAGLPRRQREVLVLHYVADLDVASIAKLLGIGVGTVKSSLSRGRQAIVRTVRTPAPATTAKEEAVTMGLKYWRVAPSDYEFGLAEGTFEGRRVASLRSTVKPARDFGACRQEIAADDYRGKRIRFAAALKAVEVTNGWAGLWLRVDGAQRGTTLAFDNMEDRAVKGTTGWQRHAIVLDVAPEAESVAFGALVFGEGELLLADLAIEEVSRDTQSRAWTSTVRGVHKTSTSARPDLQTHAQAQRCRKPPHCRPLGVGQATLSGVPS